MEKKQNIKSIFKYINSDKIKKQEVVDIFKYSIGRSKSDFSLSSFVNVYVIGSVSSTYHSIKTKYYDNQNMLDGDGLTYIIPSAKFVSNLGVNKSSDIVIFSFDKFLSKDGISNQKETNNVFFQFSGKCNISGTTSSFVSYSLDSGKNLNYILYDKRISLTSGNLMMKVLYPSDGDFLQLSGTPSSLNINYEEFAVGKVFYDDSIVCIDSFTDTVRQIWSVTGQHVIYSIPFPSVGSTESEYVGFISYMDGTIPTIQPSGYNIMFSTITSGDINVVDNKHEYLLVDFIDIEFKLNKNVHIINIDLEYDEFNYSSKNSATSDGNILVEATEENPNWIKKIGFYDYKNNHMGTAVLNIPIKKTNERKINIKVKAEY